MEPTIRQAEVELRAFGPWGARLKSGCALGPEWGWSWSPPPPSSPIVNRDQAGKHTDGKTKLKYKQTEHKPDSVGWF